MTTHSLTIADQLASALELDSSVLNKICHKKYHEALDHLDELYYLALKYQLNPLLDEVILIRNSDNEYRALITLDGWLNILNHQKHFQGMQFQESSQLTQGIPLWIECVIYRDDRILPIQIREYYSDNVQNDHFWQQMPIRMLRFRALQQCIRHAFGISCPSTSTSPLSSETPIVKTKPQTRTEQLKNVLKNQPSDTNLR